MNRYPQRFKTTSQRFSEWYEVAANGCWIWTGAKDADAGGRRLPYGKFWWTSYNKSIVAHRASWILHKGPIPDGIKVLHSCDNAPCVNPAHLFLGTSKDNTQDMFQKGRAEPMLQTRRGERSNFAKLDAVSVRAIRADTRFQRIIAVDYGITQTAVSLIRRGKNWKHVL